MFAITLEHIDERPVCVGVSEDTARWLGCDSAALVGAPQRAHAPALRVLLLTGGAVDDLARDHVDRVLLEPLQVRDLVRHITEVVEA